MSSQTSIAIPFALSVLLLPIPWAHNQFPSLSILKINASHSPLDVIEKGPKVPVWVTPLFWNPPTT